MKGIAIGLSSNSKDLLERLLKTEFVHKAYKVSMKSHTSKEMVIDISSDELKQILKDSWRELDLIIFVGSLSASLRLINPLLTRKNKVSQ